MDRSRVSCTIPYATTCLDYEYFSTFIMNLLYKYLMSNIMHLVVCILQQGEIICTPFDKSNGRYFFRRENQHDALIQFSRFLVSVLNAHTCPFWIQNISTLCINPISTAGRKTVSVTFSKSSWIIVDYMQWNLTDSDEIFQTSNFRRFLNLT